ncbi:hypothetical protein B0H14DRAFT_2648962 [Mycena olivaceomarginata]|nr:hypothetical protein B0H14DRAFT_2648962 [Mycena olivaceomarginata]
MAQRTRKAATVKPYQRSRPPRLDFLETDVSKTRLDINISSVAEPRRWRSFSLPQLSQLAAGHPEKGTRCTTCNLVVVKFGFGQYLLDPGDTEFCVIHEVCKGCWCFDQRNPEYDWDEAAIWGPPVAPPCTCPPGSTSYEERHTGCDLHNVRSMRTVPLGMTSASRPKTRADLQADLAALCKRREAASTAAYEEIAAIRTSIPSDVTRCQERDALLARLRVQSETASEKVGDAIAQVQLLRKTRLRDFNMHPPSPITDLPCLAVATSAMNYGAPRMRGSLVPAHMKNRNWNDYYRQQYPGDDTKNFDDDDEEGEAVE